MIGTCELYAREEGGEANKGEHMEEGIGAPGTCYAGEHVVVRALGGDGPLFVVADFFLSCTFVLSEPVLGVRIVLAVIPPLQRMYNIAPLSRSQKASSPVSLLSSNTENANHVPGLRIGS